MVCSVGKVALTPGFAFDRVFDETTPQEGIFDFGVKTIVEGAGGRRRSPQMS